MLAPSTAYAALAQAPRAYILYYVLFVSLLVAASAAFGATERVTLSHLLSLGVSWMFVPVVQVLIAMVLVKSAAAPKVRGSRAVALLLMGHAPWSLWLLTSAVMMAIGGYRGYQLAALIAVAPFILTCRIVHAFCVEVLQTTARGAVARTLLHQALTWSIAAVYLEKAVGLVPRIYGWLQ